MGNREKKERKEQVGLYVFRRAENVKLYVAFPFFIKNVRKRKMGEVNYGCGFCHMSKLNEVVSFTTS